MTARIVITGGTSFLGRFIVKHLCALGCQVFAIIRPTSKNARIFACESGVRTILCEMSDIDCWSKAICNADYFMHLGWDGVGAEGRADPAIQERNVSAAIACMRGAASIGCKAFLFAGSQAEYGPHTDEISEKSACNPVIEYGKGKLKVMHALSELSNQLDICYYHARIFSVYGEGDHPWALVPSCIRTLCNGEAMSLSSCTQNWNFMYATDAAQVLCALLFSKAPKGIYNVAGQDTRTLREFVEEIHAACDGEGTLVFGSYHSAEKPVSLQPDIMKLISAIGEIPCTAFRDAIDSMVCKYRETGEI